MGLSSLIGVLASALALVAGIVVHESAHAVAAYALGDRTAREHGRVSLNPLRHIDPFGTVILPLIMILAGGPVFAFAKPVPVYLGNLRHPRRDEVLVALAGPASNILVAVAGALALRTAFHGSVLEFMAAGPAAGAVADFALALISVNLSLAFFNLLPLPPLDGSSVIVPFLKGRALHRYYEMQRYAMPILIAALYLLPSLFHIDLIGWYFDMTAAPLYDSLIHFAFTR